MTEAATRKMTRTEVDGLYAITPEVADTAQLVAMTRQILEGGARLVQYRSKTSGTALRLEQARSLVRLCSKFHVPLIINDYPDLAIAAGADGVHLGQEDAPIAEARRRLGYGKLIGISCYSRLEHAVEAEGLGADYVAFGAFFASATKPDADYAPPELLRQAKEKLQVPVVAIGGINSKNASDLVRRGADAVAVSNALFSAPDIRAAAENISRLFEQRPPIPLTSTVNR